MSCLSARDGSVTPWQRFAVANRFIEVNIVTPARQSFPPKGLSGKRAGTMYSKTYYRYNIEIPEHQGYTPGLTYWQEAMSL